MSSETKRNARSEAVRSTSSDLERPVTPIWPEILGVGVLCGLVVFFLATSWRKWPDPLVDFGNGLYIAWRLAHGAILYRDVDVDYGPLSQSINGILFTLFGPGIMVVVAANLVVFCAILSLLYILFRRAWGVVPALASCAIFIIVFGFSQSVVIGNYNFATPYSQETTHGLLVCLLLLFALSRWSQKPSWQTSAVVGFLFGLTAVLKPEFILAAAAVIAAVVFLTARPRRDAFANRTTVLPGAIGAIVPTLGFACYFSVFLGWKQALVASGHAWLSSARLGSDKAQMFFLGFDHPWQNLAHELLALGWACFVLGLVGGAACIAQANVARRGMALSLATVLLLGVGLVSTFIISWHEVGRCLLGLIGVYTVVKAMVFYQNRLGEDGEREVFRLLVSVLALALLSRMILNGRIYQYGYYQAAIAAMVVPAVLLGEATAWLNLQRLGKIFLVAGCAALFIPGLIVLTEKSRELLRLKTFPVGDGRDLFYAYPPASDAEGEIVDRTVRTLRAIPAIRTLVVLPEGAMINYLARLPSPVAPLFFYAGITEGGRENNIVASFEKEPPDSIVIVSRDLRDYGITRYGERMGAGQEIMQWTATHYRTVGAIGADPFDNGERGALMLRPAAAARQRP